MAEVKRPRNPPSQIARILRQLRPPDELPHCPPFVVGVARPGQRHIPVGRPQRQLRRKHILPRRGRNLPGRLVQRHTAGSMGHHAVVHRHIHVLPPPGLAPGLQRQHHPQRRPHAGNRIPHIVPHHLRAAFRSAGQRHPAAHALHAGIVRRPVGIGAAPPRAVPVARNAGVHQRRVDCRQPFVVKTQPRQRPRPPVVQQHIRNPQHILKGPLARRLPQIQRHALFVPVHPQVTRADLRPVGALHIRIVGAGPVAAAGTLHLDHLRAHIRQNHRAKRPRHNVRGVNNAQTLQRQGQRQRLRFGRRPRFAGGIGMGSHHQLRSTPREKRGNMGRYGECARRRIVKPGCRQTIQELPARIKPRRRPAWSTETGIRPPAPGGHVQQAAGAGPRRQPPPAFPSTRNRAYSRCESSSHSARPSRTISSGRSFS